MARRVFFSFHYERDIIRASQVKNSWLTQDRQEAGFWNASLEEEAKIKGDDVIKRMIDEGLKNTSVTIVLIGAETANRRWVEYEIKQPCAMGHGLLGVYINGLKNFQKQVDHRGRNPLSHLGYDNYQGSGRRVNLDKIYPTYDYVIDNGYSNLGKWIEEAATVATR